MDAVKNIRDTAKLYGFVAIAGAALVFVGVEGWRFLSYLGGVVGTLVSERHGGGADILIPIAYLVSAASYLWSSLHSDRNSAAAYLLLGVVHLIASTGSLYGLFAVIGNLVPAFSQYDTAAVTGLVMSGMLAVYMLFHRKSHD